MDLIQKKKLTQLLILQSIKIKLEDIIKKQHNGIIFCQEIKVLQNKKSRLKVKYLKGSFISTEGKHAFLALKKQRYSYLHRT